jgi:fatty acid desaturase
MDFRKTHPPTTKLNVAISFASYSACALLLWAASHADAWWKILLCAFLFSFPANTVFSLLHESVHRLFSQNRSVNDWFGRVSAAFFPTAFTLQRGFHLGHHRRNRTDAEMFDMYYSHDNKFVKSVQWYSIFTGFYWLSAPLAAILYLVWPGFFKLSLWSRKNKFGYQTGAEAMFSSIEKETSPLKARSEVLLSLLINAGLFWALDLSFGPWLTCYWIFGMSWGALQYADHAWSPRDNRNGALNLKVNPITRWVYLNYHYHQVHHRHPSLAWFHLPKFVDPASPQKSFLKIYWQMWQGPRLATEPSPSPLDSEFSKEMEA